MLLLIVLILIVLCYTTENFWDARNKRLYFNCKYGKVDPRSMKCKNLHNRITQFKEYFNYYPIGIIYSDKETNGLVYPLLAWYDKELSKFKYYVRDSKINATEPIYIEIPSRHELMSGDVVVVPTKVNNGLFKVKLYKDLSKWTYDYYGTPVLERHVYYATPWTKIGYVTTNLTNPDDPNRYFVLYERKGGNTKFDYSITDDKGTRIPLVELEYLTNGDVVIIPGKKQFGTYTVKRYSLDDLLF